MREPGWWIPFIFAPGMFPGAMVVSIVIAAIMESAGMAIPLMPFFIVTDILSFAGLFGFIIAMVSESASSGRW